MLISSVKAKKMLSIGCIAYLAHVFNRPDKVVSSVEDTLVVKKFAEVFYDNLSRLAPKRELKFSIKLAPSIVLISKALYKMTQLNYKS